MKNLFVLSFVLFVFVAAKAQVQVDPDTKKIMYREVVTMDGTKDSLYNRAIGWINSFYKNPQAVTTLRDPENGVILCAHRFAMKETDKDGNVMTSNVIVEYKLRIEAKEGRYRYTFDEFRKKDVSMFPLERWLDKADPQYTPKCDEYLAQVDVKIKEIIASLKKGMERKVVKTDEW
ncbi:MAG TPA: DUF4468 domain-containing protein [Bacteroidales bacterium]|nr:DUF4468 domain-containing protein [Bacteroidales bacterium]